MSDKKGSEFFSERAGVRKDAHLHEPILQGIKPEDHARLMRRTKDRAKKKYNLSDAEASKLYD